MPGPTYDLTTHCGRVNPVPFVCGLRDGQELNNTHKYLCLVVWQDAQEQGVNVELVDVVSVTAWKRPVMYKYIQCMVGVVVVLQCPWHTPLLARVVVVLLQYPWQTPSLAMGGSSTTAVPLADTLASQGW